MKDYYTNCQIEFLDIDNIHGVRDAITKIYEISQNYETYNAHTRFLTQLDNTGWLQLVSKIFIGVNKILETLKIHKVNVLVHCTDGWDRTA